MKSIEEKSFLKVLQNSANVIFPQDLPYLIKRTTPNTVSLVPKTECLSLQRDNNWWHTVNKSLNNYKASYKVQRTGIACT